MKMNLLTVLTIGTMITINCASTAANACGPQLTNALYFTPSNDSALGVISLGPKFSIADTIRIYNKDGSTWYQFSYTYDDSDGKYDFYNREFEPWLFHPDNMQLGLRVTSVKNGNYEVIVNETSGLKKFVKVTDQKLAVLSIEKFLLNRSAVFFDVKKNSVREAPNGRVLRVKDESDRIARPKKVSGDWLMINYENSSSKSIQVGWIRWKKANEILIEPAVD